MSDDLITLNVLYHQYSQLKDKETKEARELGEAIKNYIKANWHEFDEDAERDDVHTVYYFTSPGTLLKLKKELNDTKELNGKYDFWKAIYLFLEANYPKAWWEDEFYGYIPEDDDVELTTREEEHENEDND